MMTQNRSVSEYWKRLLTNIWTVVVLCLLHKRLAMETGGGETGDRRALPGLAPVSFHIDHSSLLAAWA